MLALLNANTIGLSTRFHYPVDPICRGQDFTVRFLSEAPQAGAMWAAHFGQDHRNRPAASASPISQAAAPFSAAEYRQAVVSEGVPAKCVTPKRVSAKRMTLKRMTPT